MNVQSRILMPLQLFEHFGVFRNLVRRAKMVVIPVMLIEDQRIMPVDLKAEGRGVDGITWKSFKQLARSHHVYLTPLADLSGSL